MKIAKIVMAGALMLAPLLTQASSAPDWTYLSFGVIGTGHAKELGDKFDLKGYRLDTSYAVAPYVSVGAMINARHIRQTTNFELATQQFGVYGNYPLGLGPVTLDFFGGVNLERVNLGGNVGIGYGADLGIRTRILSDFEAGLRLKPYSDVDFRVADAKYTGYELHAVWQFLPKFSLLATFGSNKLKVEGSELRYRNVATLGIRFGG